MRHINRCLKFIILCIVCQLCIACSAKQHLTYDGPPKARTDIALLVSFFSWSFNKEKDIVCIEVIDGKTGFRGSSWDGEYEIELLPGVHEIIVSMGRGPYNPPPKALTFNFEPGQIYTVKPNLSQTTEHWAPSIVNITDKMTK